MQAADTSSSKGVGGMSEATESADPCRGHQASGIPLCSLLPSSFSSPWAPSTVVLPSPPCRNVIKPVVAPFVLKNAIQAASPKSPQNQHMSSVATEEMSSVATEEMSSVATEDMSSVEMCENWVVPRPEWGRHGSPRADTLGKRSHGLQEGF